MLVLLLLLAAWGSPARGEVFHSRESALRLAFAEADSFSRRALVLGGEQAQRAAERSRTPIPSRLVNVHQAWRAGEVVGYAYIETHDVRSLPETILVALRPDGSTRGVHLLAFHEPEQYRPPPRWLAQFDGRSLGPQLALRRGIQGISGSTLTANAVTSAVRRVLALHAVLFEPPAAAPDDDQAQVSRSP